MVEGLVKTGRLDAIWNFCILMDGFCMDLILLGFLFLVFSGVRRRKEALVDLDAEALLPVRGVCAIVIVFHHIAQYFGQIGATVSLFFALFYPFGNLPVGLFFAVSGYALSVQYAQRGEAYLDGFVKKRLGAVLLPYLLVLEPFVVLYAIQDSLCGVAWYVSPLARLLMRLRFGETIVLFGWYVEMVAVLYLVFYGACRVFKRSAVGRYLVVLGCILVIIAGLSRTNYGGVWYGSLLSFVVGMGYFSFTQSKVGQKVPAWLAVLVSGVAFGGILWVGGCTSGAVKILVSNLLFGSFGLLVFQLVRVFGMRSKVFCYLGSRSYEIYLCQGLPMVVFGAKMLNVRQPVVYTVLVLGCTLVLGEGLYRIDGRLWRPGRRKMEDGRTAKQSS